MGEGLAGRLDPWPFTGMTVRCHRPHSGRHCKVGWHEPSQPRVGGQADGQVISGPSGQVFSGQWGGGELSPNDHQGWVGHPEKVAAPNQCKGSRGSYLMSQGLLPFQRPDISPGYPRGRGRRDIPVLVSAGINLYPEQEIYPAQKDNTPSR
jgi:hypothetical protein